MKNIVELSESGFESEVLRATGPVIVDFYAPWCGPCKILAPILEQFASELDGRVKFAKLNVDDASTLAARYGISGVPTLALFLGGRQLDTLVGFPGAKALKAWLEKAAAAAPQPASASNV